MNVHGSPAILALFAILSVGCSASTAPRRFTPVMASVLPYDVAVEPGPDADGAIRALRATGIFRRVAQLSQVDTPDLIAEVVLWHRSSEAALPFATVLTIGLWPTLFEESARFTIELRSPTDASKKVVFSHRHDGRAVLGWAAGINALSPKWVVRKSSLQERFGAPFSKLLEERLTKIRELVESR